LARVARAALDVCHFDPDTLEDVRRAPHAREDCEAACYDCLLSYSNTRYHDLIDRQLVKDLLSELAQSTTEVGAGRKSRSEQLAELRRRADPASRLEQDFLGFLEAGDYRLPDEAQKHFSELGANPDFFYGESAACVYVDGPHHDYPERAARDSAANARLRDAGYEVIRFTARADWRAVVARYPWVFGEGKA